MKSTAKYVIGLVALLCAGVTGNVHAQCPHQGLASFGPISPAGFGYPAYYVDQNGLALGTCLDPADLLCGLPPLPNPAAPLDIANGNFFDEHLYTFVTADVPMPGGGIGLVVFAVTGTFGNAAGAVVAGDQVVFSRVRFRIDTPAAGTYTITHPFGVHTLTAAAAGRRSINFTDDCLLSVPPTCGPAGLNAFTTPLAPFSWISTWLQWDATPPAPPAGHIGDPAVLHTIKGSPCGTNFFRVEGPGLPAGGVVTNLWSVLGKKASICGNGVVEPGEQCDDGNTLDGDCCSSTCQFDPAGAPCTGTNVCLTATTCNGAGVCGGGTPTLSACNDGNVCTVADTCFNGACVGVPNACNDANVCTTDFCTPPTVGCGHLNNALACDDGNAATVGDSCSGSKCMGFTRDAKLTLIAGENPSLSAAFPAAGDARTNGTSVRVSLINMDPARFPAGCTGAAITVGGISGTATVTPFAAQAAPLVRATAVNFLVPGTVAAGSTASIRLSCTVGGVTHSTRWSGVVANAPAPAPAPCTPTTCAAQGKNCGTIPDGCGGTLTCGVCTAPLTCGGGGVANVCGTGAPAPVTAALTLTATGRAGETVSSTPAGLSVRVGSTGSATFPVGTSIRLGVTNGRSVIWSGVCSSGGAKTPSCTFTLNAASSETANVQ